MRTKIGVMGSADDTLPADLSEQLRARGEELGRAIASVPDLILLTGGTTGLPFIVGKAALGAGALHVGISPAENEREHTERYRLPTEACHAMIYTGFGLKGRNVVLVRSCDIVLFIGGSMGSLNEFTIAHDEGRVIGCLTGTGGVADEAENLLKRVPKKRAAEIFFDPDPNSLLRSCLAALKS